jgi:AcrR family transcriptional regulator
MTAKRRRSNAPWVDETRDLKSRLAAAARQRLERDGLEALTLRAVARDVGVSHMAPYRHFDSKDALLAAVAEQGFHALTRTMAASRPGSWVGAAYVAFALDNPGLYRLMFSGKLAPFDRFPALVAAGANAFQMCLQACGTDATSPQARPDDARRRAAVALWSIVHGLATLAMEGLVTLPAPGPQREAEIAAILRSMPQRE